MSNRYLGINLTKEVKDLYAKNYKTLMKSTKMISRNGTILHSLGLEELILLKWLAILTKATYTFNVIPMKLPHDIIHRARKHNPKIHIYTRKTQNCQSDCEEKELSWRHNSPRVYIRQSYSNDNSVVLAQKQIYGSAQQNRDLRNKPTHVWLIIFNKRGKNKQ